MQTVGTRLKTVTRLNHKMKSENKIASIPLLTPQNHLSDFILQKNSILGYRKWSFIELFYKKEYEEDLEPPIHRNQYINNELYLNFHIDNKSNHEVYSQNNIQAIKKVNQSIEEFENNNTDRISDSSILIHQIKNIQSNIIEEVIKENKDTQFNTSNSLEINKFIVGVNHLTNSLIRQLEKQTTANNTTVNSNQSFIKSEELINSYEAYLVKVQRLYNTFVQKNAAVKSLLKKNTITSFSTENISNKISSRNGLSVFEIEENTSRYDNKNAPVSLFYHEELKDNALELEKSKKGISKDTLELISEIKNIQSNIIEEVIKENKDAQFNTSNSLEINKFIVEVNHLSNSLIRQLEKGQLEKQTAVNSTTVNSREKINIPSNTEINNNQINNKETIDSEKLIENNQLFVKNEELISSYEEYFVKVQRLYNTFVQKNTAVKSLLKKNTITSFNTENIRNKISSRNGLSVFGIEENTSRYDNKNAPVSLFYHEELKDSTLELEKNKKDISKDTLELISEIKNIQSNIIEEFIKGNKDTQFNTRNSLEINKFIVEVNHLSNSLIRQLEKGQLEKQTAVNNTTVNSREKINIPSNTEINNNQINNNQINNNQINNNQINNKETIDSEKLIENNQLFVKNEDMISSYEEYLVKVQRLYNTFVQKNTTVESLLKKNTITSFNTENIRNKISSRNGLSVFGIEENTSRYDNKNAPISLFYHEELKDSTLEPEKSKKDIPKDNLDLANEIRRIQSSIIEQVIRENKDTKVTPSSKSLETNKFIVGVNQLSDSLIRQLEKETTHNNTIINNTEKINIPSNKEISNNQLFTENEDLINSYEEYLVKVQRLYNTFVQNNTAVKSSLKKNTITSFNTEKFNTENISNKISSRNELNVFGMEENTSNYDIYKSAPISLFYPEQLKDSALEFEKSKKDIPKDNLVLVSEIRRIQSSIIEQVIRENKDTKVNPSSKSLEINQFIVGVNQLSDSLIRQLEKETTRSSYQFIKNESLINSYEEYLTKIHKLYSTFIQSDKSVKILSSKNIMSLFNEQDNKLKISNINRLNILNGEEYISDYAIYNSNPVSLFYHEDIKESDVIGRNEKGVHNSMLNKMLLTKKVYQAIQIYEHNLTVGERENTRLEKNIILKEKIGINHQSFFESFRNMPINLTQGQINKLDVKEGKMVVVLPKLNFEKHSESEMMILVPPGYSNQPAYPNASNQLFNGNMKNQANYNAPINKASTDYVTDFKASKASKTQNEVKSINEQMKTNVQKLKQTVNYDIGQLERGQMTKLVDTVYKQIEERLIRERRRSGL